MKIEKQIEEALDNSRTDNYQKAEKAGGNVELTKNYLKAGERYLKNGAVVKKRKGLKKFKKGAVTLNKKVDDKNPKYFFGGLLNTIAGITPIGMGINALRKRKEEKEGGKQSGRIMKVKVISDGSAEQAGKDDTEQASKEEQEKLENMEGGGENESTGSGAASMKKGGVARRYVSVMKKKKGVVIKRKGRKK